MKTMATVLAAAVIASLCTAATMHFLVAGRGPHDSDLERRLQALEAPRPARHAAVDASALPASASRSHGIPLETKDGELAERENADGAMRELGNRFRAEPVSAAWARNTEIAVLEALMSDEAKAAGSALPKDVDVKCKSTLCNITATYPDDGAAADATTVLAMDIGDVLPRTMRRVAYNADGTVQVLIYAMK